MTSTCRGPFDQPSAFKSTLLLRPLLLSQREAEFAVRGFQASSRRKQVELELIGRAFIGGYNNAILADDLAELRVTIERVDENLRGFAVEGSAMGTAVRDAFTWRNPKLPALLAEFDRDFIYLAHVGCGWAAARLPWRREAIRRSLDPLLRWLAFDGMGFHDGYFKFRPILEGWQRVKKGYHGRAYDQGVGRAVWFISGGSVAGALEVLQRFPIRRRDDLWAGLGLAMAYSGSGEACDFSAAASAAAIHKASFAQGVAFACEARDRAKWIPPFATVAANLIWNLPARELATLVREAREGLPGGTPDVPNYEIWRRRVAAAFADSNLEAA